MFKIFTDIGNLFSFHLLGLSPDSRGGKAIQFFIEDTGKILFLLVVSIYIISFLRAALDNDKVRDYLTGVHRLAGYFLASVFGAITPFCSCSSIPLFLGFTSARIPLGITMAFLITSPMINEVAILLLGTLFGLKFTLIYIATGVTAGVLGGLFIDWIGAEKYLKPIGQKAASCGCEGSCSPAAAVKEAKMTLEERHQFASREVKEIFSKVWKWVILGIAVGAVFHGYIPDGFLEQYLNNGSWWSVPLAVLLGIPLYAGADGIIPIAQSLMAKGMPIGTTMAFMMSTVAASFPEFTMLKQVMKPQLLGLFFMMLLVFFTLAGWLFNIVF